MACDCHPPEAEGFLGPVSSTGQAIISGLAGLGRLDGLVKWYGQVKVGARDGRHPRRDCRAALAMTTLADARDCWIPARKRRI